MAKKRKSGSMTIVRERAAAPVVIREQVRAPSRRRRAAAVLGVAAHHGGKLAKRGGRRVAVHALENKHFYGAVLGGAGLGLMKRMGWKPGAKIPFLGTTGTAAAVALGIAWITKNRTARHVATGLTTLFAYQLAAGESTAGMEDD